MRPQTAHSRAIVARNPAASSRAGFTMIELLVAVGIMLILTTLAVTLFNVSVDAERIRSSARQIQSYLEGARDRAILSREPRGVRFLIDTNGPPNASGLHTVRSMIFIGATEPLTGYLKIYDEPTEDTIIQNNKLDVEDQDGDGMIDPGEDINGNGKLDVEDLNNNNQLDFIDLNGNGLWDAGVVLVQVTTGSNAPLPNEFWSGLALRELLIKDAKITVFKNSGSRKTPQALAPSSFTASGSLAHPSQAVPYAAAFPSPLLGKSEVLVLNSAPAWYQPSDNDPTIQYQYQLSMAPTVLPNQEPTELGAGIAIDLAVSKLPSSWMLGSPYSRHLDLMFSPRGTVMGPAAATGLVHFYMADMVDIEIGMTPGALSEDGNANGVLDSGEDVNSNGELDVRQGDQMIVTLFTRTGHISSHPVHPTDLFFYAETGAEEP